MDSPQQTEHDVASQSNIAAIVGGLVVVVGLGVAILSYIVPGLLIVIVGILLFTSLKLDAALMAIATNQCAIIELQRETIKELRHGSRQAEG